MTASLGRRLRRWRRAHRLTPAEQAAMLGVSLTTLRRVELDAAGLTRRTVARVETFLQRWSNR